jgi:hypothetical protein
MMVVRRRMIVVMTAVMHIDVNAGDDGSKGSDAAICIKVAAT